MNAGLTWVITMGRNKKSRGPYFQRFGVSPGDRYQKLQWCDEVKHARRFHSRSEAETQLVLFRQRTSFSSPGPRVIRVRARRHIEPYWIVRVDRDGAAWCWYREGSHERPKDSFGVIWTFNQQFAFRFDSLRMACVAARLVRKQGPPQGHDVKVIRVQSKHAPARLEKLATITHIDGTSDTHILLELTAGDIEYTVRVPRRVHTGSLRGAGSDGVGQRFRVVLQQEQGR